MIIQNNSFMSCTLPPYLLHNPCYKNAKKYRIPFSKKQDFTEKLKTKEEPTIRSFRVPKLFLARSAVTILGLGFIDAGYSGDWSRIGVISKENEELLKIAAFVVVPLCLYLIFILSEQEHEEA